MLPGFAAAQAAGVSNQLPSPSSASSQVLLTVHAQNYSASGQSVTGLGALGVNVFQGNVCGSLWSVIRHMLPFGGANNGTLLNEAFQGEIATTVGSNTRDLWIDIGSNYPQGPQLPAMFINTPYGTFPINFCNASSFNLQVGNVTYVNGLPTVTNTITFNDIALPTYGQGSSTVTLILTQNIIANWTNMTVNIGVYADLSNMKLYLSDGTEIPQNTDFSLNLMYGISMDQGNPIGSSTITNVPYAPSDITSTTVFFSLNETTGTQLSVADMNFGGTYTDIQGSNQITNETQTTYFQSIPPPSNWAVNCFQSFPNLTYGVTTAVQSDPTITVQHNAVSAGGILDSNLVLYGAIAASVASVAIVVGVISVKRKNARKIAT